MRPLQPLIDEDITEPDDDNGFTICGFKSPQKIQWMNGRGKSLKLSRILETLNTHTEPCILEIAVSWNESYQRTSILNITKDIAHQYCTFNPSHHEPINRDNDSSSNDEENMSEITDENYSNITDEKLDDFGDLLQTQPITTNSDMKLMEINAVKPLNSAPTVTYKQCLQIYAHIPIINDHISKHEKTGSNYANETGMDCNDEEMKHANIGNIPKEIDLQKQKTLTKIGHCLALEELFAILCWKQSSNFAVKIQFADVITINNATELVIKYRNFFRFDSVSCLWFHGIFLDEFPSNNTHKISIFETKKSNNKLCFADFIENIKKVPALTISLSWPGNNISAVKHPASLKLCLSSILSEISIGSEHDIIIHFPIQYMHDCYYIINDILTNKSYFPYVAFNFFNIHNNLHNFVFGKYYKLKNGNHKNGINKSQPMLTKQSSSSWSIFGRKNKVPKHEMSQIPYDTNISDVRNLKQEQIVCKSDLDWLSAHIHQLFTFTSVSCVRFKNSPNDEFRKILGQHRVREWTGRLSWNPKSKPHSPHGQTRPKRQKSVPSHVYAAQNRLKLDHSRTKSVMGMAMHQSSDERKEYKTDIKNHSFSHLKQPSIDWDLWQLARLDSKSRHFQSCIYNRNIGLAQRNGGWLISTRELRAPYRIKGRFFSGDKHGVLSIYIRCSSVEYPCQNELPLFSVGVHIGNEKLKIVTNRLQNGLKQLSQQCGIGATIDNGYDFQIIDRGVMYPIVCQVERTGKDGKGDNFPQGKNVQIAYPRDSSHWMYHCMFVNSSNEWIIIDRLVVDEKKNSDR